MVLNLTKSEHTIRTRVAGSARFEREGELYKLRFGAMSTDCRVLFHGISAPQAQAYQQNVLDWVAGFEAKYSRFIPDSLIGRINAAAGQHWVDVDQEADQLLSFCQNAVFFTEGAFDPTALPLIRLWNWRRPNPGVPETSQIEAARRLVGWQHVQRKPGAIYLPMKGMSLDLGGIGKEFAVDMVAELAFQSGIRNVLVDFGHDIRAIGAAPGKESWSVGLEDPDKPGACWVGLKIRNAAVATSGDYVRFSQIGGRRYGHIIDPRTGYPVDNECRASSVIASSCTLAGLLSTTSFILGAKAGLAAIERHLGTEGALSIGSRRLCTRRFYGYAIQQNTP